MTEDEQRYLFHVPYYYRIGKNPPLYSLPLHLYTYLPTCVTHSSLTFLTKYSITISAAPRKIATKEERMEEQSNLFFKSV